MKSHYPVVGFFFLTNCTSCFAVKDLEKKKDTSGKPKPKEVGKLKPPVPTEDTELIPLPKPEGENLLKEVWG